MKRLEELRQRRQRILDGLINCIPLCFSRFSAYYPGVERYKYNLLAASQKAGKTKVTDKIFMYEPFFYMCEHPSEVDLHIIYFPLESNPNDKIDELYCFLLWRFDGILIDKKTLRSTDKDNPCPEYILDLLETPKYKECVDRFMQCVDFYDITKPKNPTAVYEYCRRFAESNGEFSYRDGKVQNEDGEWVDGKVRDKLIPYKENSYWIVILDNFANITTESGLDQRRSIEKLSKYFITLRDMYGFNINAIQHLALASEDTSGRNFGHEVDLTPSASNLGDAKTTARDINSMMSIFYPYKYGIRTYPQENGYDITKFRSYIRFLKMCENRDDESGKQVALFFIGQIGEFYELPPPDDIEGLNKWLRLVKILDYMKQNKIIGNPHDYTVVNDKVVEKNKRTETIMFIRAVGANVKKLLFNQK